MNESQTNDPRLGESALDPQLSARTRNVIERIWGKEARRGDLVAPDAYQRLSQSMRVGPTTLDEIERALATWGLPGIGGRQQVDLHTRRLALLRTRLGTALADFGLKEVLAALAEVAGERAFSARKGLTFRGSRTRRRRYERQVAYYAACEVFLRRSAEEAPRRDE